MPPCGALDAALSLSSSEESKNGFLHRCNAIIDRRHTSCVHWLGRCAGGLPEQADTFHPDGHTILLVTAAHAINPLLFRDQPYDAIKDFAPVATLVSTELP